MKKEKTSDLRKRAEKIASEKTSPENIEMMSPEERRMLLHELRVHQVELEMQNEELRRTQTELDTQRERYFDLYDLAPVGYVTVSEKGLILEANLTTATLLGVTRSALVKQLLTNFIIRDDQDIYYRYRKELFVSGEPQAWELRLIKPDGALFWAHLTATAAQGEDGAPVSRVMISDITPRKQIENIFTFLAQSSSNPASGDFFQLLAQYISEALNMGFVCIDRLDGDNLTAHTVAVYSSGKFEDNVSYALKDTPCGEVVGKHVCCFPASIKNLFPNDAVLQQMEAESYIGVTLWSHDGRPIGLIAVIGAQPITNRAQAESLLKIVAVRAAGELERKQAEEEKRDLEERLIRAEKMESLGLLAGGVAHDLNNVLGIVVGYAELVLDSVDEKSPLRKDLTTIFDGGQRAAAIVDDLLTLARRGVVGKKVLNLNKLIADFKKSPQWSKLLTYHPSVKIQIELEQDLLNIAASSIHLEKTLYNLVSNAAEAMTSGGNINIKTSNQYIDKPISGYDNIHEGDYVVLSVSDEGDGISEIDLKRIFEPFYTKKIMGRSGTGLGLSVVWGTVKDHQGYIDVHSEEGKGTTFILYFLITREDIEEELLGVSMAEYLGNEESILVVDDVKDQRELATRLLKALNYKVSSVASGEEAIKYLKDHQPDLIVLDMIMDPGMDGLDTYKSILEINPKQKAIIVSGFSESDRVKEAKALGAGAYIKKPYIKAKLGLAVKKELARK